MINFLFWLVFFVVVRFADDVREVYKTKLPIKSQQKLIVEIYDLDENHNAHYSAPYDMGHFIKIELNLTHFYKNPDFLLSLWEDLAEIFQKQLEVLKKSTFW